MEVKGNVWTNVVESNKAGLKRTMSNGGLRVSEIRLADLMVGDEQLRIVDKQK